MPFITVEQETLLYYKLYGSGTTKIICIGGLDANHVFWADFAQQFDPGVYSFCMFDNRGAGFSSVPSGRYTTSIMAKDTLKLIDHLGWEGVHVVSVSLGGMIAQHVALLSKTGQIKSIALLSTFAKVNMDATAILVGVGLVNEVISQTIFGTNKKAHDKANELIDLMFPLIWLEKRPDGHETNRERIYRLLSQMINDMPRMNPIGHRNQFLASLTHHVTETDLQAITEKGIKSLVMTGDNDKMIDAKNSTYLAQHLGCEVIVLKDTGHCIPRQHPELLKDYLIQHFE